MQQYKELQNDNITCCTYKWLKQKEHGEAYKTTMKDIIPPYLTSKLCSLLSFFLIKILFALFFLCWTNSTFTIVILNFDLRDLEEKIKMKYIHVVGIMYCVHLSIFPQKLGFLTKWKYCTLNYTYMEKIKYTWHCVNVKSSIWLLENINVSVNHLH